MSTLTNDKARGQLIAIFGNDLDHLPNHLRTAARHHRESAEHLRTRQPDALIPADGARMLAEGHDVDADRCDRIAERVEAIMHGDGDAPVAAPTRRRRPHVITVTGDAALRSAVDTAAARTRATVAHYNDAAKARRAAPGADLVIIGVDLARLFPTPVAGKGTTVVAGIDLADRAAASDHADRLGADLFALRAPGEDTLTALLATLPVAEAVA